MKGLVPDQYFEISFLLRSSPVKVSPWYVLGENEKISISSLLSQIFTHQKIIRMKLNCVLRIDNNNVLGTPTPRVEQDSLCNSKSLL